MSALSSNVRKNPPDDFRSHVSVAPYRWGDTSSTFATSHQGKYTRILAADTLWLSSEHENLATSMMYLLSAAPHARVFVIAGFHTGRDMLVHFFEEVVPAVEIEGKSLVVESIWEMDADGRRRNWTTKRNDDISERKKWAVVACLKKQNLRQQQDMQLSDQKSQSL